MTSGINKLLNTVARLRSPQKGCPWDRAQTHESLVPYFKEELYEFLDDLTFKGASHPDTWTELGDVIFQCVLHAQLLSEEKLTNFDEICERCAEKIISRHPHVFDPNHPGFHSADEVNQAWEKLKASAGPRKAPSVSESISAVSRSLPQLQRAARLGEKAAAFSFDWPSSDAAFDKVVEEVQELKSELHDENRAREEWGDLVFALAQYARKRKWDPESLLAAANEKFTQRIQTMEDLMKAKGERWEDLSLEPLEVYWQLTKSTPK